MSKFLATAFGLALGLGSAAAYAADPVATLTGIDGDGKVLVNRGDEFVPAAEGMRLSPGDRVMVQDGSSAVIKFDDECVTSVSQNKIVTISDRSSCAGGVPIVQELNPTGASAIGGGSAAGATGTGNGGVLAMVGVVAAIDVWALNEGEETVSP